MPTGLTEALKHKRYDIKAWLQSDIIRQFGVCVILRDSAGNMGAKDIEIELEKDARSLGWEISREMAERQLARLRRMKASDLEAAWKDEDSRVAKENDIQIRERAEEKLSLNEALGRLKKVRSPKDSILEKAVSMAIDQIETVLHHDYSGEARVQRRYTSATEWLEAREQELTKEIHMAIDIMVGNEQRGRERLHAYQQYLRDIDKALTDV